MSRSLTQQEMADHLGVTLRTYQNYESDSHAPSFEALILICQKLDVSSDRLLGLSDEAPSGGR